jgi:hypothetical protein
MHRPETEIDKEVKIVCNNRSQQTESMKTIA